MFASSWRSPAGGVSSSRRWICSELSSTPSAAVFSSTRETRLVPGIGAMSSPCASSHANATCAGVASSSEATAWTSSKHFNHPVVGELHLSYNRLDLAADPGLTLFTYTAEPGSRADEALKLLGSWAATLDRDEATHATQD